MNGDESTLRNRGAALWVGLKSPHLHMALCTFSWATNVLLARAVHTETSPIGLNFWRWVFAAAVMLLVAGGRMWSAREALLARWKYLLLTGFCGVALFHSTSYMALDSTTALNVGFINSVTPIVIVAMSWVLFRDRLTLWQAVGIVVSLLGVLTIVFRGDPAVLLKLEFNRGDLWSAGGMPVWGLYTVLLFRRPREIDPLALVAAIVCVGAVMLLPPFLLEPLWDTGMQYTFVTLSAALYIGIVPSALAYILWNRAVSLVGANKAGLYLHLIPVFTTLMAMMFLQERPQMFHGGAIVLIVTGLWLTTRATPDPA